MGDTFFFAVSGFCLASIREKNFFKWYSKRIFRIYPTVFIMTVITYFVGEYEIKSVYDFIEAFVYPTRFHFIASIMLLYIFYFFVMRIQFLKNRLPVVMAVLGVVWLVTYIFIFDKSVRLDVAQGPFTKFLFFEAMLFGAYAATNKDKFLNNDSIIKRICFVASVLLYLALKILIDKFELKDFQFLIVLSIFVSACMAITAFCGMEQKLSNNRFINAVSNFIAPLTLEIYVVQHTIIVSIVDIKFLKFPLNFFVVSAAIIISAFVLNKLVYQIRKVLEKIFIKAKDTSGSK